MRNGHLSSFLFVYIQSFGGKPEVFSGWPPAPRDHVGSPEVMEAVGPDGHVSPHLRSAAHPNDTMPKVSSFKGQAKIGCFFLFPF